MKKSILLTRHVVIGLAALAILLLDADSSSALMSDHECAYCHSLHGAPGFTLLNQTSAANLVLTAEVVCLYCHGPGGSSSLQADIHRSDIPGATNNRISCIECHDAHDHQQNSNGVDNLNMVLKTITAMSPALVDINVIFFDNVYSDDNSHDYSKPDGTGVCQVCHTLTSRQRNDGFGEGHQRGALCTSCHPHSSSFDNSP